jgi:hypothetical protein
MGMEVDEAGRDDEAVGIDYLFGKAGCAAADLRNFAVANPNVGLITGNASPIDDGSAFDLNVEISHPWFLLMR